MRRTRDIMPGDKKPDPSETENNEGKTTYLRSGTNEENSKM